jgi:hypothetical protein
MISYFADGLSLMKAADAFRPRFRHRGAWSRRAKPLADGFYVFTPPDPRAKTTKTFRRPFHQWTIRPMRTKRWSETLALYRRKMKTFW